MKSAARIVLTLALLVAVYPVLHTHLPTAADAHSEHEASCLLTILQKCGPQLDASPIIVEKPVPVAKTATGRELPPASANVLDCSRLRGPPVLS